MEPKARSLLSSWRAPQCSLPPEGPPPRGSLKVSGFRAHCKQNDLCKPPNKSSNSEMKKPKSNSFHLLITLKWGTEPQTSHILNQRKKHHIENHCSVPRTRCAREVIPLTSTEPQYFNLHFPNCLWEWASFHMFIGYLGFLFSTSPFPIFPIRLVICFQTHWPFSARHHSWPNIFCRFGRLHGISRHDTE